MGDSYLLVHPEHALLHRQLHGKVPVSSIENIQRRRLPAELRTEQRKITKRADDDDDKDKE